MALSALLVPTAIATLIPAEKHRFCPDSDCDVMYFSSRGHSHRADVQVPACSGDTRADLAHAQMEGRAETRSQAIQAPLRAGRGAYEVGTPQGRCCLGHVRRALGATQGTP